MTDNVNKFNAANRMVGYKKAAQAVNFAAEFSSRGIELRAMDEFLGGQNEK